MAYALGLDFGTLSGRVVLLDLGTGREAAVQVVPYRHGVIDTTLPGTGEALPPDWALQDPRDYLDVLQEGIPAALAAAHVAAGDVVGFGVDFTSCTVLPVTAEGTPLCLMPEWAAHRHAWPKLWKHHAAQPVADRINRVARARGEAFLARYGGRISAEWQFPKLIEIFEEDRAVYDACAYFLEATDWIVWQLTGRRACNSCTAGYKGLWSAADGLPSAEFFAAVSPGFQDPAAKFPEALFPLGSRAGTLRPELAQRLGLLSTVAVAVGNVDAMVCVPAVGVDGPGTFVMVMGTSICHLALSEREVRLPGITGVVKDGVLPGLYGYESGQAAVGDMYEWFTRTQVPNAYAAGAKARGVSPYAYLEELAGRLAPGQSGLLALDWWNGNRSILGDADLSGVVVGLSLATAPEEIYRALLESTALGTRCIVENFQEHGIAFHRLVACGGLPLKSPLLMQIYADVCDLPVSVCASEEIPARGAAMFGAVAAGAAAGGFASIEEASAALSAPVLKTYLPQPAARERYEEIYRIFRELYAFFGQERADLLHRLKQMRLDTLR